MNNKILIFGLFISIFLVGCGIKTQDYHSSADNLMVLKQYTKKVKVDDFSANTSDENHILCRLAETISTPTGETFTQYIQKALVEELKMAGLYDKNSNIKITGNLNDIYGSSFIGNAFWEFDITIKEQSSQTSFNVKSRTDYPSTYLAMTACTNMANSFNRSVKELINKIITHEDFEKIMR